jgi:hypothetical protein
VDHVSAYLLDGPFAWPSNEELEEAAAAGVLARPAEASAAAVSAAEAAAAAGASAEDQCEIVAQQQVQQAAVSVLQQLLARKARVVPLLDRFGVGMDVQVATSVHPR